MVLAEAQIDPNPSVNVGDKPSGRRGGQKWQVTPLFWRRFFQGLAVLTLATMIGGLIALERLADLSYLEMADKFSWMVLVQGDSLQTDEVGGHLKLLPGARDVVFVSAEAAFQDLQKDPLYMNDTNAFQASDLPASWRVRWDPRSVDFSLLPLFAEDARRITGVVDVAYDPRQLEMIHRLRAHHFAIQAVLWMAGLVASLGALFLFGRMFFFHGQLAWSGRLMGWAILRDELWWLAGSALIWKFLGHALPWPAALGGIVVGLIHVSWDALERR